MSLKEKYAISDKERLRLEAVYEEYKKLRENPDNCTPMLAISVEGYGSDFYVPYEEQMKDPLKMLEKSLVIYQQHLEIGDDVVPTVRVEFGTAQVAAAFGCKLGMPTDAAPIAISHAINKLEDIYKVKKPFLTDGIYPKLKEYTEVYIDNLPEGMYIQHPDIQSAFNTAHLVRGNDILLDFYDDPSAVHYLLNVITDHMIDLVHFIKGFTKDPFEGWFFDWGAMWKGHARISNCTTHLISPETYRDFVLPYDVKLMESIGGGRIHYCGTHGKVINYFSSNPYVAGLDYDNKYHDLWMLSEQVPKEFVLLQDFNLNSETGKRIMSGDLPKKRNLILRTSVRTIEEGRDIYQQFKEICSK